MKNTVTFVGFVGNNPEVRTAQSGAAITSLSLATTRSFKDGEGNRQTETGVEDVQSTMAPDHLLQWRRQVRRRACHQGCDGHGHRAHSLHQVD